MGSVTEPDDGHLKRLSAGLSRLAGQTPLDDISGLRRRDVRSIAQLNVAEAENIRKAVMRHVVASGPGARVRFGVAWSRRVHKDMFGDVWAWAGTFRGHETNLGASPGQIETLLHELFEDFSAWRASGMEAIEQAARLHHRAVLIHPFANGNGRWARMLATIVLRVHDGSVLAWPEATLGGTSDVRGEYLRVMRDADRGDIAGLLAMHRRYQARTLG